MSEDFQGCTKMLAADVLRGATRWRTGLRRRKQVWDYHMAAHLLRWYATLSWFNHLMTFNTWRRRSPEQLRAWFDDQWSWDLPKELQRLPDGREAPPGTAEAQRWIKWSEGLPPATVMFVPCDMAAVIASWDNDREDPWLKPTDPPQVS